MFRKRKHLEETYAALYEKYCELKKERDTLQAEHEAMLDEIAGLKGEAALEIAAERLKNEGLRAQIQALEERKAKQWNNLLGYDGRPQADNLGGVDDE